MPARRTEEYVERVLSLVEQVPPGRVTTYGLIAEVVGSGPRLVLLEAERFPKTL